MIGSLVKATEDSIIEKNLEEFYKKCPEAKEYIENSNKMFEELWNEGIKICKRIEKNEKEKKIRLIFNGSNSEIIIEIELFKFNFEKFRNEIKSFEFGRRCYNKIFFNYSWKRAQNDSLKIRDIHIAYKAIEKIKPILKSVLNQEEEII